MTESWEQVFQEKQAMWGFEPADCVIVTVELFKKHGLKKVLIPGFGYGRNAKVFADNGFDITGIEISKTAIDLAKKHYGEDIKVHHGSVSEMPFDNEIYDGVFCYALIHLLNEKERAKLIRDSYNQLRIGGYMVFVAISKKTATYGQGKEVGKDTFLTPHGVTMFYYDVESVEEEFGNYGILVAKEINEPATQTSGKPSQKFWQITSRKKEHKNGND